MRGEHWYAKYSLSSVDGIIPACAGSTVETLFKQFAHLGSSPHARGAPPSQAYRLQLAWDHPRMRGEHDNTKAWNVKVIGIIPACAGSTPFSSLSMSMPSGSSPHARGAPSTRENLFIR